MSDQTIEVPEAVRTAPDAARTMPDTVNRLSDRQTTEVLKQLLDDTQLLIQKHIELAKLEMMEAIDARIKGAVAGAVAGVMALFALGFLAASAAYGLANVMPDWLARFIVGGAFLLIAGGAGLFAMKKMSQPPMAPEETQRALKEDKEWARAQLRR